jgi:hypothetical protein
VQCVKDLVKKEVNEGKIKPPQVIKEEEKKPDLSSQTPL